VSEESSVRGRMVLNATFNNISVISWAGCQFYWWRKPDDPEKTTDLSLRRLLKYDVNISLLYKDVFGVRYFCYYPYWICVYTGNFVFEKVSWVQLKGNVRRKVDDVNSS
jgi:hypothetical protein